MTALHSPVSGAALRREGDLLVAQGESWPVVDGIAYLRTGRADLVASVVACGDPAEAAALLLQDRDDWAPGAPPALDACREVVRRRDTLTFREAMALLEYGPVADYLAHRWSDPTYLSGLALAEAHWRPDARIIELACGTGAYLRAFAPHAAAVTGADIVFSKVWLARHFVAPSATLLCFDAASPWPVAGGVADVLFCHDAFYFLPDKPAVARRMQAAAGTVLIGHAHDADADNLSSGAPLTASGYARLFDDPVLYDDAELTASWLDRRTPHPLAGPAAAVALASRAGPPRAVSGFLDRPRADAMLRRNPLYDGSCRRFPSARYAAEYAALASYPETTDAPAEIPAWQADEALVRRRVLLDLPPRW